LVCSFLNRVAYQANLSKTFTGLALEVPVSLHRIDNRHCFEVAKSLQLLHECFPIDPVPLIKPLQIDGVVNVRPEHWRCVGVIGDPPERFGEQQGLRFRENESSRVHGGKGYTDVQGRAGSFPIGCLRGA
jgi:hypothetical protein